MGPKWPYYLKLPGIPNLLLAAFLLVSLPSLRAQSSPIVSSELDTTAIRIGEQIRYKITVETDSSSVVFFPEGQTFSPLETVEAFKTDTTRAEGRMILQRTYALTQFDSGVYQLPAQRVEVDGRGFLTDSATIQVATVPVDTTVQKMYDIKPLIEVEKSHAELWNTILIIVFILLLAAGLYYYFFMRKKPLTEEEKEALLPPYDRALLELKRLENSRYLIQDEYKKYYSELTGIVRSYLEEEVHITALESTTRELIEKLELLKDAGELGLNDETISQFSRILQTADLVKFARSKPPTSKAEKDRKMVEEIVIKTREALPEPTEEELMQREEYLEEIARKKRRNKRIWMGTAAAAAVLLIFGGFSAYYGPRYIWDTVTGHPTKKLLEGEWVSSTYGYPPISLETPEVLLRQPTDLPPGARAQIKELHEFQYQSEEGIFRVGMSSKMLAEQKEPDYKETVESLLLELEENGARNIITKEEEFTTTTGVRGLKIYGSGTFQPRGTRKSIKGQYAIILFGGNGFQQQLVLYWPDDDPYAEQIVERVLGSLEVKTQV